MTLDRPMVLPADAVGRLVRAAGIGELHVTLAATARWLPAAEETAEDERAWAAIAAAGALDRHGRVDRDVEATLGLLCRPAVEYYGWLFEGERTIGVLAAATGRDAVLAVRTGDDVALTQVHPDALAAALVSQAPPCPPGTGQPVQFDPAELRELPVGRRRPAVELRQIRHVTSLPTTGGGQLSVAVRDGAGRRRSARAPIRYADTAEGRWLNLTVHGPDPQVLLAPATPGALVSRLDTLRSTLGRH